MDTPTWNIIEKYSDFNYWTPSTKELSAKYGAAVDATRQARTAAEEAITAANAGAANAVALKDITKLIATARKLTYEALQIEVETRQTLEALCKSAGDDYYAHVKLSEAKLA